MGYAFVIGNCFTCGSRFTFNPVRVPSVRDSNNVRQPICQGCIDFANKNRKAAGVELIVVASDAYEAVNELELG